MYSLKSHDISNEKQDYKLAIDSVGLQNVKIPVKLNTRIQNSADVSLFVSLDSPFNRGIHMSRLYLILHEHFSKKPLSFSLLKTALIKGIKSQKGISSSGSLQIKTKWPILRKALKSPLTGWREYPYHLEVNYSAKTKQFEFLASSEVLYSSTCPCSSSLSTQMIKNHLIKNFPKKEKGSKKEFLKYLNKEDFLIATPHAQKSTAFFKIKLQISTQNKFSMIPLIDQIETCLGTPVQTAVKREDEAEFAIKNASNLMFCEDAVRRIGYLFKNKKEFKDYFIRVEHYESLHPFTVQASIAKGVKGGWKAYS
ncbi:MAG: GTP cyclohydrolase I FolE2 [Bdellovibrionales bacterium]|nr:GTP cyclohydrolase I FolE2 [Bdellovibrionales bacterium]